MITSRMRASLLLVSSSGDDVTERDHSGDIVSVVSNSEMDSDLGPTKWEVSDIEEPIFSCHTDETDSI